MSNIKTQVSEILTANGLDFRIEKAPMYAKNAAGIEVPSPYFGLINSKSNEVINTVKEGYTISQNDEVVEMVLEGMTKFGSDLSVSKAGSLNGGRKVFLQLGIEGDGLVGGDRIKRYVTVIDSNDGSTSLSIGIGDLTMSCANQFFKFYKKGEAKFRHTATLADKIKSIPFLIETALNESLRQVEVYNLLADVDVAERLVHEMVKEVLGYDREITSMDVLSKKSTRAINTMDKLYANIQREMAQKGQNLWGLHSGITRFSTHEMSAPKRDNGRIESGLIGNAYNLNQKSLKFATSKAMILDFA
jgi:phage/plasmid-like protein (TIGR03299 family)